MTFSRPLRMSWLIVGISAFQHDRRLEDAGGSRKSFGMSLTAETDPGRKEARIILAVLLLSSRSLAFFQRTCAPAPRPRHDGAAAHDPARLRRDRDQRN